jgi:hypothetical protein
MSCGESHQPSCDRTTARRRRGHRFWLVLAGWHRTASYLERAGTSGRNELVSANPILPRIVVRRLNSQTVAPNLPTEILAANCASRAGKRFSPLPPTCKRSRWRALFGDSSGEYREIRTVWRRGADSNPRDPSGFEGRNSTRVWRTIRPEQKHPCWREFVRLGFGSSSELSGTLRSLG